MAGDNVEPLDVGGVDGFMDVSLIDDAFVYGAFHFCDIHAQTARSVGLRIGIDDEYVLLERGERCCKVNCRSGLSDTTFLVC